MIGSKSSSLAPLTLITQFGEDCLTRGLTPETARRYLSSLKIFNKYLEENDLNLIETDRNTLRNFINYLRTDRGVSQRTIETYFASMASFNPVVSIPVPP